MLRQPFIEVMEPPRYATVTGFPAFSFARKFPTPLRTRISSAFTDSTMPFTVFGASAHVAFAASADARIIPNLVLT